MYLKRIALAGFKSFPDRVVFDFPPGVTCVVGPNGCGKSNLVDAFKWVLGEQSAKSLRGRQMVDMIFNGSSSRKSSGVAQVDLSFENSDRGLGVDRDEVVITRKLYRSGESEYQINKDTARLKDVRDLFMDTGIGADSYSVIEQGRVGRLLDSSPVERRAIFEEAAGIGRYKTRKREAERKLERTQQNLLRVNDIVDEVQRCLRSVKLAAGKARRFQEHDERLRALRASFSLAEYQRLGESITGLEQRLEAASDESTEARTCIGCNEAVLAKLADQVDTVTAELSVTEQKLMRTRSDIATHEERIDASQKHIGEQRSNLERARNRLEHSQQQQAEQEKRLSQVQEVAVSLQKETHEHESRIRDLGARDRTMAEAIIETRANLEDEKDGLVDLMRRTTQLRNEITSLKTHREKLESEHGRLGERHAAIRAELEDYLEQKRELESRVAEITKLIEAETKCLDEKRAEAERLDAHRASLTSSLADAKEARSGLRSHLTLLDELERKMEGVGAGVRALLEKKAAAPDDEVFKSIRGMVGDVFDADVVHAKIIEAAIGDLDQYVVLGHSDAFLSYQDLFDALPGRLSAVCLDRLPPVITEPVLPDHPGVVSSAVDMVRYDGEYARLVRHLLGKTVVVDTLEHALALARTDPSERRFVTLAGEVVEPNGCVSVGPPSSRAGLIARKSERRNVETEMADVESRISSLEQQLERTASDSAHLDTVQGELRSAILEADTAKVDANASLERVNEAVRRLSQEQPLIAGEVVMIEQQMHEAAQRTTESSESVEVLDRESDARKQAVAAHTERLETMSEERERVQFSLTEARITVGKLAEKRAATAENINELRRSAREAVEAIEAAELELSDAEKRISDSEDVILTARARLGELGMSADRLEADGVELRRRRELLRLESEELSVSTKKFRSQLEEIESRVHAIDLELQTAVVHRDELVARVTQELSLDLPALAAERESAELDVEGVEKEIAELREKIQRLGNVNLDAINELEELENREQFLTSQRDDLEDSRKQLETLIAKLDAESMERFTKAFDAIRTNFRELFRKLFGGGKADVILEDPNDPLGCGIEVLARPPGKEIQRISLMSGGEKTMTAIALVMSIFRSQPSPFAFLDEVDAALDEANNARFNEIIRDFLDRSQFIVVTHSKRTMAIADQLYGITMQEPGVSGRVSVKFDQESPSEQTAVA